MARLVFSTATLLAFALGTSAQQQRLRTGYNGPPLAPELAPVYTQPQGPEQAKPSSPLQYGGPQHPQVNPATPPVAPAGTTHQQELPPASGQYPPTTPGGADDDKDLIRFLDPKIKGYPIDYCMEYHGQGDNRRGVGCGQEAASLFCREQGLKEAKFYLATYYSHNATFTLGDGEINPQDVGGGLGRHTFFTNITCSSIDDGVMDDPMRGGDPSSPSSAPAASGTYHLHQEGKHIGASGVEDGGN